MPRAKKAEKTTKVTVSQPNYEWLSERGPSAAVVLNQLLSSMREKDCVPFPSCPTTPKEAYFHSGFFTKESNYIGPDEPPEH